MLSGDLYHYPEERVLDCVPTFEFNVDQTRATRVAIDAFLKKRGAALYTARLQRQCEAEKVAQLLRVRSDGAPLIWKWLRANRRAFYASALTMRKTRESLSGKRQRFSRK